MQKDLERKLNKLKKIEASKEWKAGLKSELFQEEKTHFLFRSIQPKLAFGSLAVAGFLLTLIVVGTAQSYPDVDIVENKIDHRVMAAMERMQERNEEMDMMAAQDEEEETDDDMGMMAVEDQDQTMTAEVDFDDLSEEEQRQIVRESTEELLAELNEVEERVMRVMGSR